MADQATKDDTTKSAVVKLLTKGLITKAEAARLSGRSHQLISYWARDIDLVAARDEFVRSVWARAIKTRRR